jgi:aldose 1-epimerase
MRLERRKKLSVQKKVFGLTKEGKEAYLFTIMNEKGMKIQLTNYGAILVSAFVENREGVLKDIVLGYDKLEDYFINDLMFGATVGRNVNRIEGAQFEIDGTTYYLAKNNNGNNIHSDKVNGFHKVLWDYKIIADNAVEFSYRSIDGEQGFPGNLDISVTYSLSNANEIIISYRGVSDKKTLINLTNHSYFNLSGHEYGDIHNTKVKINADYYTPIKSGIIPNGEITEVKGTPMDFTKPKLIGKEIESDFEQLSLAQGYDHNFVLKNQDIGIRKIAEASSELEGITMEIYSDQPGLQFYAGNTMKNTIGKEGVEYKKRSGFCMEPHFYPNSINIENFKSPIFDEGEEYKTTTIYQFV